jgi:hypothetical protein
LSIKEPSVLGIWNQSEKLFTSFGHLKKPQRTARFHEGTGGFPGGYFDLPKKKLRNIVIYIRTE